LVLIAEKNVSARDWNQIRQGLSACIVEEERRSRNGKTRTFIGPTRRSLPNSPTIALYVEQGKSRKATNGGDHFPHVAP